MPESIDTILTGWVAPPVPPATEAVGEYPTMTVEPDPARWSNLRFFSYAKDHIPVSATLAKSNWGERARRQVYMHANIAIKAFRLGVAGRRVNVSREYFPYRVMRTWIAPIDAKTLAPTAAYAMDEIQEGRLVDTVDRKTSQATFDPDAPGMIITAKVTEPGRQVQEFWFGWRRAKDDNETPPFGGIYYVVCIDFTPTRYRVRVSKAFNVSAEELEKVITTPGLSSMPPDRPWHDPEELDQIPNGGWLARHMSPKDWAAINNALPAVSEPPP